MAIRSSLHEKFKELPKQKSQFVTLNQSHNIRGALSELCFKSDNKTIVSPHVVRTRREFNKDPRFLQEVKVNYNVLQRYIQEATRKPIAQNNKGFAYISMQNKSKNELETTNEETELEMKRKRVAAMKAHEIAARIRRRMRLKEIKAACREDKVQYYTVVPKKAIKEIKLEVLKPKQFIPYELSNNLEIPDNQYRFIPRSLLHVNNPVFLHLNRRNHLEINTDKFITDLSKELEPPQYYTSKKYEPNPKRNLIAVMPKEIKLGSSDPKELIPDDYIDYFAYYKLNPTTVINTIKENLIDKEITMGELKELLVIMGLPLKDNQTYMIEEEKDTVVKTIPKKKINFKDDYKRAEKFYEFYTVDKSPKNETPMTKAKFHEILFKMNNQHFSDHDITDESTTLNAIGHEFKPTIPHKKDMKRNSGRINVVCSEIEQPKEVEYSYKPKYLKKDNTGKNYETYNIKMHAQLFDDNKKISDEVEENDLKPELEIQDNSLKNSKVISIIYLSIYLSIYPYCSFCFSIYIFYLDFYFHFSFFPSFFFSFFLSFFILS